MLILVHSSTKETQFEVAATSKVLPVEAPPIYGYKTHSFVLARLLTTSNYFICSLHDPAQTRQRLLRLEHQWLQVKVGRWALLV